MKELLTLKEAAALAGKTTKTIKNYIKQGKITNFFLVEGKYGQEYRINLKDIEPLLKKGGDRTKGKIGTTPGKKRQHLDNRNFNVGTISREEIYDTPEYTFLLRRNDDLLMELGRLQEKVKKLNNSNLELRQEMEEKNMLIAMLMKKDTSGTS